MTWHDLDFFFSFTAQFPAAAGNTVSSSRQVRQYADCHPNASAEGHLQWRMPQAGAQLLPWPYGCVGGMEHRQLCAQCVQYRSMVACGAPYAGGIVRDNQSQDGPQRENGAVEADVSSNSCGDPGDDGSVARRHAT
jgi:hypothetical protein